MTKLRSAFLALCLISAASAAAQATFTAGIPATTATPAKLVLNVSPGTTQAVSGTIVGDTFPAKSLTIGPLTVGGVTIPQFPVPNTVTLPWAITFQVNTGANAASVQIVITAAAPFTLQATVNAATPVTGTF
jgi:hypothetical protein